MNKAYLLTGGNLGDRPAYLQLAKHHIQQACGSIQSASDLYETEAWGIREQGDFLNQALCVQTLLPPQELLRIILNIEQEMGRFRAVKNGPRTIDIDIIFYNDWILQEEGLVIPHPRMQERRFVLAALKDIAPDYQHPVLGLTIETLYMQCQDPLQVRAYQPK